MGVRLKYREDKHAGRKGKWWVYVYYQGREKAKCVGTDEKVAKKIAKQLAAKLTLGDVGLLNEEPEAPRRPFEVYFQRWLDTYVKVHCKPATYENYETAFRVHLEPHFRGKDIGAITREDVKQLAYGLLTPPSPETKARSRNTVRATLAPLKAMFNHAIEDGHVTSVNPALRILKKSRTDLGDARAKVGFLTREEAQHLLGVCQEEKDLRAHYPLLLCLLRTGMRVGEAIALQWGDLDFNARFATVQRTMDDGQKVTTPKSGKARRVDLSTKLTEVLKALLVDRKRVTLRKGWGELPAWVFVNGAGGAIDADNFRKRVWPKLLEKAELRKIRIHDLRHTYASLLIQQGESLAYVKDQMGHSGVGITVDTYGHLVPGGNKAAVDRLDEPVQPTKPDQDRTSAATAATAKR